MSRMEHGVFVLALCPMPYAINDGVALMTGAGSRSDRSRGARLIRHSLASAELRRGGNHPTYWINCSFQWFNGQLIRLRRTSDFIREGLALV